MSEAGVTPMRSDAVGRAVDWRRRDALLLLLTRKA